MGRYFDGGFATKEQTEYIGEAGWYLNKSLIYESYGVIRKLK